MNLESDFLFWGLPKINLGDPNMIFGMKHMKTVELKNCADAHFFELFKGDLPGRSPPVCGAAVPPKQLLKKSNRNFIRKLFVYKNFQIKVTPVFHSVKIHFHQEFDSDSGNTPKLHKLAKSNNPNEKF